MSLSSRPGAFVQTVALTPLTRAVLIALMVALSFSLGSLMDVTILVMALGLFNIGVIVFLLLRKDITWGFIFYLTAVIFFQTGFWIRLPAFPDLYPARVASILLYLVFLIQILLGIREVPRLSRIEKVMILFIIALVISMVTSGSRPRWLVLMRGYLYPFLFFYFARAVITERKQIQIVMGYLALIGIYFGVMGVFEGLHMYEFVFPKFIVDPSVADRGLSRLGFRVRGIFLQPAVLGCVMTMGFFPAWLYLGRLRGILPRITQLVLLLVTPPTIFYTLTRSVYLGFAMALIVAAIWSRRLRALSVGLVLAAAVGAFLNWDNLSSEERGKGGVGTVETVLYRIEVMYVAAEIFMDNPFFGCGFYNFTEVAMDYRKPRDVPFFGHIDLGLGEEAVLHNMIVTVIAEQGLTGVVPYMLIFIFILLKSVHAYRILPRQGLVSKDYVVCVWCAMACYFVNAMFLELRYFEYINVLYFFLMGIAVGMTERFEARQLDLGPEGAQDAAPVRRSIPWPERRPGPTVRAISRGGETR